MRILRHFTVFGAGEAARLAAFVNGGDAFEPTLPGGTVVAMDVVDVVPAGAFVRVEYSFEIPPPEATQ